MGLIIWGKKGGSDQGGKKRQLLLNRMKCWAIEDENKTHGYSYIPKQWRVLPDFGLDIDNNQSISIAKKVIYIQFCCSEN